MNCKFSTQLIIHLVRYIVHQGYQKKWRLISLALTLLTWGYWSQPVRGEGTGQLFQSGTNRALTEWKEDRTSSIPAPGGKAETFGIPRRTILQVYVKGDETINVGSSAMGVSGSTTDPKRIGNALIYSPNANIDSPYPDDTNNGTGLLVNCVTQQPGKGIITTRTQETTGPFPAAGGYTPCTFTATASGIYTVVLTGPRGRYRDDEPTGIFPLSLNNPLTTTKQLTGVAAWDITVTSSGTAQKGRVFTNYLSLLAGSNQPINTNLYVATKDGYQYAIQGTNLEPDGAIFFSNNRGFTSGGNALYRSINTSDLSTVTFQRPNQPDTATDFTNKLFFNPPATETLAALKDLNFKSSPELPQKFTNFQFTGCEETPNQMGTFINNGTAPNLDNPQCLTNYRGGGNFKFFNPNDTAKSYTLRIDIDGMDADGDGDPFNDPKDVILLGTAPGGGNITQFWDGKDGEGNPVPATTVPLKIDLKINVGETHFPFLDVENSGGVSITPINIPKVLTYYNDSFFDNIPGPGKPSGIPNPDNLLRGKDSSSTPVHIFSNGGNFGNDKGMDQWVFVPFPGLDFNPEISIIEADLAIEKTVGSASVPQAKTLAAFPGDQVTFNLTVTNNGPSNVPALTPARVLDTIDPNITGVTWTCSVPAGTGTCGAPSGAGNKIDTTVVLNTGATATYTITGTISPSVNIATIPNNAQVLRGNDVTDPTDPNKKGEGNNSSNATITISIRPQLFKSVKWVGDTDGSGTPTVGDILEYSVRVNNPSATLPINNIIVKDVTPAALQIIRNSIQINNPAFTTAATLPATDFDGTGDPANPTILTNPGTLAPGGNAIITYQARIKPSAIGSLQNQALANFDGDNGTPINSDASDTPTSSTGTGTTDAGFASPDGSVKQAAGGPFDPTEIIIFGPPNVSPTGTKSVILAEDLDNNGEVSNGDILEYTVTYFNFSIANVVTNFLATDKIDTSVVEFAGGYSFTAIPGPAKPGIDTSVTVTENSTFNGTTDLNLTNPNIKGQIGGNGSRVVITYRVKVIGQKDQEIQNTAKASSTGGNIPLSLTTVLPGPRSVALPPPPNATTPQPTIVRIQGRGIAAFRLVKRITNILRNGAPLPGVNFTAVTPNPNDPNESSPAWPKNFLQGITSLGSENTILEGDIVEYTIYFLSDGTDTAKKIKICDTMPEGTIFEPDTFTSGQGIQLRLGATQTNLSNSVDIDKGRFFSILEPSTKPCKNSGTNPTGSVFVDVGDVPIETPNNAGFVRFRLRVNE